MLWFFNTFWPFLLVLYVTVWLLTLNLIYNFLRHAYLNMCGCHKQHDIPLKPSHLAFFSLLYHMCICSGFGSHSLTSALTLSHMRGQDRDRDRGTAGWLDGRRKAVGARGSPLLLSVSSFSSLSSLISVSLLSVSVSLLSPLTLIHICTPSPLRRKEGGGGGKEGRRRRRRMGYLLCLVSACSHKGQSQPCPPHPVSVFYHVDITGHGFRALTVLSFCVCIYNFFQWDKKGAVSFLCILFFCDILASTQHAWAWHHKYFPNVCKSSLLPISIYIWYVWYHHRNNKYKHNYI